VNNTEFDKRHIWHPYTSATQPLPCYEVVAADGCELTFADGRTVIDGMASWWSTIHGYNHPEINAAVSTQLNKFAHVMFGGITHQPAIDLCRTLLDIVPPGLSRVFLADSGSVSVEVAMKMAIQYWACLGQPQKHRMVTIRDGYHGDTFAAMSVCDPVNGMHSLFEGVLAKQLFAPSPQCRFGHPFIEDDILPLQELIEQYHNDIAALILEPIVQNTGGIRMYSPEYVKRCRQLCDQYDILLICDEIATGFGRTGKMFACEHADITPDILCVGKALTGGYMSLAAAICTEDVANGVCQGEPGVFMHGPTFMGNPLACSAANANLELLMKGDWVEQVHNIEKQMKAQLAPCKDHQSVADVRVLGGIGAVEMKSPVNVAQVQASLIKKGVWLRPFGKLLYMMPPYIISEQELTTVADAVVEVTRTL